MNMSDYKELQNKKKNMLLNLNKEELETYIQSLAHKYHVNLLKKDSKGLEYVIECLKDIVLIYELKYSHISEYIDYCILKSSKEVFEKVFELDCSLWSPSDKSIASSNGLKTLTFSLEESRRKIINEECNVKELYEKVINDDNVSDEVIEGMTDLYNAFKMFNYSEEL